MKKRPPASEDLATLRESEARLRAIFDTAVEGIIMIDEGGLIDAVNPAAERMFGWTAAQLAGKNIKTLMPEPYRGQHDGYLSHYKTTGQRRVIGIGREVFGQRRDGTVFPIDLSVGEFSAGGRRLYAGIVRDITARRRLQAEVLRVSESEQQRIGRDLHDDLCQQLAGIEFLSQTLAQRLTKARRTEAAAADEIARLIREATEHTRDLSHGMSPVGLEPDGLMSALEELAVRTRRHFQVGVEFRCPGPVLVENSEISTHLYRIAQEAVSNALKHGKADRIEIGLIGTGNHIHLCVRDNGRGFPVRPKRKHSGMGLSIMQYRAGVIGGSLVVGNEPAGGVTIGCSVHLLSGSGLATQSHPSNETSAPEKRRRPPHSAGR